ncbi:uncharacterized protein [Primulina huaijiensis]|uniref:uncharacterized protein n=1 Tax=Primulina huaijiensis TaxID=1492673 RepID=UPI003CC76568
MRPVKGSDPTPGNGEKNGEIGPGLGADHIPVTINIKVSHGDNGCEVSVPSDSSFGHLKSVAGQKMGLKSELLKLLFRGIEKADDDNLLSAGVKNNSKVSLVDYLSSEQKIPEEVKETNAISIGAAAVAEVREEVDMLSEKVSALKVVVDRGTKVDVKDILYLTEMLMRQLLKLDGIEAEGEGKVQRKQEVRRVQSLVDTMDILKSKNSSITSNANNTESISTPGTVEPDSGSSNIPPTAPPSAPQSVPASTSQPVPPSAPSPTPLPSSSLPSEAPPLDPSVVPHPNTSVAQPHSNLYPQVHSDPHVELHSNHYPDPHSNPYPEPHSNPYPVPHSYTYSAPHSNLYSEPHSSPYPMAYSGYYAHPYSSYYHNYAEPHLVPYQVQYATALPPISYSAPYPGQYTSPSTAAHNSYPYTTPHSNSPYPPSAPHPPSHPVPYSDPYNVPSSNTKVTQNWERFE